MLTTFRLAIILLGLLAPIVLPAQESQAEIEVAPGEVYTVNVRYDKNSYFVHIQEKEGEKKKTFSVSSLTNEALSDFVKHTMKDGPSETIPGDKEKVVDANVSVGFVEIMSAIFNAEQKGQEIATVKIKKKKVDLYCKNDKTEVLKNKFEVDQCQLVFEEGFIKTIIVTGTIDKKDYTFSNGISPGITIRTNNQKLIRYKLTNEHNVKDSWYIRVGDLITYNRIAGIYTNDYSPEDQVIILLPDEKERTVSKTPSSKLFTLNIFTDLVGIQAENPNGLIQFELNKRINFWTERHPIWYGRVGLGIFTHLTPSFELTKIEDNNRAAPLLEGIEMNETVFFTSPLELYRHSFSRVKADLNLMDFQGAAASLHLNGFFGVNIAQVNDTTNTTAPFKIIDETVNSFLYGFNAKVLFNPDSKWSFLFSTSSFWMDNLKDGIRFSSPVSENSLDESNKFLHSAEFLLTWNTNKNNKLFGRFRFNHEWAYPKNNFSEIQVGYSIFFQSLRKK